MYDIIGDIHGCAGPLKRLLTDLGYRDSGQYWSHPERQVLFLGDFVDRGPEQEEVLRIARAMCEHGQARAVMGNHEFNAVCFATADPEVPGDYLRAHSPKNQKQHAEFLREIPFGSAAHRDWISWFRTLPLWLDLPALRLIHACWHPAQQTALDPSLDAQKRLTAEGFVAASHRDTPAHEAVEVLLKGLEVSLPEGISFQDKDGNTRHEVRVKWWLDEPAPFSEGTIAPADVLRQLPETGMPTQAALGYDGHKPVFVGHYWLSGTPAPCTETVACLDFSVAKGDKLCAYRSDGAPRLLPENFVWVDA